MNGQESAITDGKYYGQKDMVRANCHDCMGCCDCCQGMGDSILLDPYDMYMLQKAGVGSGMELLQKELIELGIHKGLILAHIKMQNETGRCGFLSDQGRCTIHGNRPGICRLFPLGRNYEEDKLSYILLKDACSNPNRTKVKVSKWIGIEPAGQYHYFLENWHQFRRQMEECMADANEQQKNQFMQYLLQVFYLQGYDMNRDFYEQYKERTARILEAFS